ncbi:MAG: response regulator, partial [Leptospiraceae bacterium]|nr:response regulator [Leptospiraceae bacterium]
SNAIKFTETGEVKLEVKLRNIKNEVYEFNFSIIDTGIGIPENKVLEIFEKFTQVSSNTSRKYGGTGLGLAIVKKLINLMNSEIYLSSRMGKGSKFYFNLALPAVSDEETKKTRETEVYNSNRHISFSDIKVLIVEDNYLNTYLMEKILKKKNVLYDSCFNGEEAIMYLKDKDYHIIFMDIQMPVMDGITATKNIRNFESSKKRNIPIVAFTANVLEEEREKALQAGVDDYLTKPYEPETVYKVIKKYCAEV